ncbi:5-hydroxytryptamine receptor 1D-like [Dreissena polymorpha]|uniref:G-protein coupled receptors family 1 profile domain-containing protein n=1 Tax=Dreissena polymorpha TaxID=45954 RepID=A0A9D4HCY6_DREPO|nr:5-hydroxytryptamine receptor 1D-like [Dreissena polymorpha]KAH3715310.1 hypothetical protein DPMN_058016 [Dreissena polymorpha]
MDNASNWNTEAESYSTSGLDVIFTMDMDNSSHAPTTLNTSMYSLYNGMYNNSFGVNMMNYTRGNNSIQNTSFASQDGFQHIPKFDFPVMILICVILAVMILATIIGNVFVIAAIILERSLQGVSNYLILSLAVTDLLVAVSVMPLSLVNEISVHWYLGSTVCDFWISIDVLCCTASILHLVAISLDRFWGVSNIDYIRRRSAKQILKMVAVVWFVAFTISIPPLFGWKEKSNNPEINGVCVISQNLVYTVFSTVGAFYCPVVMMVFLNFKIYVVARTRIRKKNFVKSKPIPSHVTNADMKTYARTSSCSDDEGYTMCNGSMAVTTALNEEMQYSDSNTLTDKNEGNYPGYLTVPNKLWVPRSNGLIEPNDISCTTHLTELQDTEFNGSHSPVSEQVPHCNRKMQFNGNKTNDNNNHRLDLFRLKKKHREADRKRKDKLEMKRERKAAKVLGIITGAFIACWLPFFVLAVLAPFCGERCNIPTVVFSLFLWLGYFNSTLNPILYTIFNPSFRKAFQKIIYGKYRVVG